MSGTCQGYWVCIVITGAPTAPKIPLDENGYEDDDDDHHDDDDGDDRDRRCLGRVVKKKNNKTRCFRWMEATGRRGVCPIALPSPSFGS